MAGVKCLVSRTGYTGEDGFELYCANADAPALWNALLEAGKDDGLIPCGLGARDTLRLEAAMPLYGHEMDDTVSPLEAGLGVGGQDAARTTSSARPRWWEMSSPHAAAWGSRSPGAALRASTATCT